MVFYQVKQYERFVFSHLDYPMDTEANCQRINKMLVQKSKQAVADGKMQDGMFDVIVCKTNGEEIDAFISGTDYEY